MDEEEAKKKEAEQEELFDPDDEFFKEYRAKVMEQMQQRLLNAYDTDFRMNIVFYWILSFDLDLVLDKNLI